MSDKETVKKYTETLIQLTNDFCDQHLNEEYKALCEKAIRMMARKKTVPFLSGKIESWAAAFVYAIGSKNLLFDKHSQLYMSATELCGLFGFAVSTIAAKAKIIRDTLKIHYYSPDFSTLEMREQSPFGAYLDGMPLPFSFLSPELQEIVKEDPEKKPLILKSTKRKR